MNHIELTILISKHDSYIYGTSYDIVVLYGRCICGDMDLNIGKDRSL
jgi:hypothetical protein